LITSNEGDKQWVSLEGDVDLWFEENDHCIFCGGTLPTLDALSSSTREKLGSWAFCCKDCISGDISRPCIECEGGIIENMTREGITPVSIQATKERVQWTTCEKITLVSSQKVSILRCLNNHVLLLMYHVQEVKPLLEWRVVLEGECHDEILDGGAKAIFIIQSKDVILDIFSMLEFVYDLVNSIDTCGNSIGELELVHYGTFLIGKRLEELASFNESLMRCGRVEDPVLDLNCIPGPSRAINERRMRLGAKFSSSRILLKRSRVLQVHAWIEREIEKFNQMHPFQLGAQLHLPMNLAIHPCLSKNVHVGVSGKWIKGRIIHCWGKFIILQGSTGEGAQLVVYDLRDLIGKKIRFIPKGGKSNEINYM
jgi:hypothetical protein